MKSLLLKKMAFVTTLMICFTLSAQISQKPIAYWNFDEGSGTTSTDQVGSVNFATKAGATTLWASTSANDEPLIGDAVYVDLGGDYWESASNPLNGIESGSISLWVRPRDVSGYKALLFPSTALEGTGPYNGYWGFGTERRDVGAGNQAAFDFRMGGPTRRNQYVEGYDYNAYYHLALTWSKTDTTEAKIYVNGILQGTHLVSTFRMDDALWQIGADRSDARRPRAAFDELAMFDAVLTLDDIQQIYNAGVAGNPLSDITPKDPLTGISITSSDVSLYIAQEQELAYTLTPVDPDISAGFTWESSNTDFVTVDANGKVTGVAEGSATITVKYNDDETITSTCNVTVSAVTPLATLPDAYWNFDEGAGTTTTDLIGGVDFETKEGADNLWASSSDTNKSLIGDAVYVEYGGDYWESAANPLQGDENGSISLWVRAWSGGGYKALLFPSKALESNPPVVPYNGYWGFAYKQDDVGAGNQVTFDFRTGGPSRKNQYVTGHDYNTYYHLALTWSKTDTTEAKYYINGELQGSFLVSSFRMDDAMWQIGADRSDTRRPRAAFDELAMFNTALSDDDIAKIYYAGLSDVSLWGILPVPRLSATGVNPATCLDNGTINLTFENVPDGDYTITYDGGTFDNVTVTTGAASVSAAAGQYNNLTITVDGITSAGGVSVTLSSPDGPDAPSVSVTDNCDGTSTLTASDYTGTLTWSTTETTESITVSTAGDYTVKQTVAGCDSENASGTAAPKLTPTIAASANNPATCGVDGSIDITLTNVANGSYTIAYTGGQFDNVEVTDGSASVDAAPAVYSSLSISVDGCTSAEDINVTVNELSLPDAPTASDISEEETEPIQTLTATATVGAGEEVVWYDAATDGSIVASPTLNIVGTATYYAAAHNFTTTCESVTRTSVTLTITEKVVPALVSVMLDSSDGFNLYAGSTHSLVFTINPTDADTTEGFEWSSSAPTVVSVDQSGNIEALAEGQSTITVAYKGNGAIKSECVVTVEEETSGINTEIAAESVAMYPNPAVSIVNVEFNTQEVSVERIQVFDAAGVLLISDECEPGQKKATINVSGMQTGLYIVSIVTENNELIIKKLNINR